MIMDDKIRDATTQCDINREAAKTSVLLSGKIDKYNYLTGEEILPSHQNRIIKQAKFTYSSLGKAFEKQIKTIEDQGEKQIKALEVHGKQLDKYSNEKDSSTHSKQKETLEELTNGRMEEIVHLSKQIDFNNLIYHDKGNAPAKTFMGFKGPLIFFKNIKKGNIALGKEEEEEKEFKSKLNKLVKGSKKSEDQKSATSNIKTLCKSREKVFKLYLKLKIKQSI